MALALVVNALYRRYNNGFLWRTNKDL